MNFTHFHPHQLDNYARLALAGGGIYAAAPGTGKTLAAFAVPTLIAAHQSPITNRQSPFTPPSIRFYLTSYTALGQNGGDEWPADRKGKSPAIARRMRKGITDPGFFVGIGQEKHYRVNEDEDETRGGAETRTIRCIGTPTLATALTALGCVIDCAVADEAVRAKNTDTFAGEALARLTCPHRFAFSGTPIKSNLPDIHPLAEWVSSSPSSSSSSSSSSSPPFTVLIIAPEQLHEQFLETARDIFQIGMTVLNTAADAFADPILSARMSQPTNHQSPITNHKSLPGAARFTDLFLAVETNHTKTRRAALAGKRRKFTAPSHTITRRHLLHRTLAPLILRQRKDDLGIPLIENMKHTIQLPFATAQWRTYRDLANHKSPITNHTAITALRQAATMSPAQLACPKLEWTLRKLAEKMHEGKQCIVLSPFTAFSKALRDILHTFDIPALLLDGSTSPARRGHLAKHFKTGHYPVLIGGHRSMGTGSSFPNAQCLIKTGDEWGHDDNDQADQRHDRIDSPANVDTYTLITTGSIDERIHQRAASRAANAGAALGDDGMTGPEFPAAEEESLADVLRNLGSMNLAPAEDEATIAARIHNQHGPHLRATYQRYREHHPAIVPAADRTRTKKPEIKTALAALRKPAAAEKNDNKSRMTAALNRLKKLAKL